MTSEKLPDGKALQREYMRRWRAEHREQVRAYTARYWDRKAQQLREAANQTDIETRQEAN